MPYLEPKTDADKQVLEHIRFVSEMRANHKNPGYLFGCMETFVLRHGQFFTPSALPATVKPMRLQVCFENAYRVALRTEAYHYVEGYAFSMAPFHHAWLIDKDGNVVDPTWSQEKHGLSYFGVELNLEEVKLSRRSGSTTLLGDYQRDYPVLRGVNVIAKNAWFRR